MPAQGFQGAPHVEGARRQRECPVVRQMDRSLGQHAYDVPVSSTKSAIGHLLGAAGAVEAIATIAALRNGVAPPTLGLEQPDEGLDLDFVQGEAEPLPPPNGRKPIGISNSFGFGGHNAVLVLESA